MNAWLSAKLADYQLEMQDSAKEFFIAENNLNRAPGNFKATKNYYCACMNLADIAYQNGDDGSYIQALKKLYHHLLRQLERCQNPQYHKSVYGLTRQCLKLLCQHYITLDSSERAAYFRNHFVAQVPK